LSSSGGSELRDSLILGVTRLTDAMATVTDTVKETLVGTTREPQLSAQAKATFDKHAKKDEAGELYMSDEEFVDAIAPKDEDYVSARALANVSRLLDMPFSDAAY
jgi:hypothetical protein